MVRNSTVIVLGAGASKEVNLPTGDELKAQIAKLLDFQSKRGQGLVHGDELIADTLKGLAGDFSHYIRAARLIRNALPLAKSIDDFLEVHKANKTVEFCGKLAIVRSVLKAERKSTLYFDEAPGVLPPNYLWNLEKTWLVKFVRVLTESCPIAQLPDRLRSIAFIVFNYDRCFEHFLLHAFRTFYGIVADQAAELVKGSDIYHPYGTVGHLPWQQSNGAIAFGNDELGPHKLVELTAQIKTFTEGVHTSGDIPKIKQKVQDADMLIFLGFAFHPINLDLLRPEFAGDGPPPARLGTSVFATALDVSDSDCNVIKNALGRFGIGGGAVALANMKCSQLFDTYQRTFALE